jgi:hypothetical protein
MLKLSPEQLLEAIEFLYEAIEILESVLGEIKSSSMRGFVISESLAKAWYKVNCCRIHTEPDVNLEELNLEAMGFINDAKSMMDSLMSWQKGMTRHGKINISSCLEAAMGNLRQVLCMLEDWLHYLQSEQASTTNIHPA